LVFLGAVLVSAKGLADGAEDEVWLPVVATRNKVDDALASAVELRRHGPDLVLVATEDCRNLGKGLYVVVAGVHDRRTTAESAVAKWRALGVHDAYLRSCRVVVPSRLSLDIPLLDPSFMNRRIEAVNWDMEDAVSRVIVLDDRLAALVIPRYEDDPEDVREGLRIGVRLYHRLEDRIVDLSPDCIDPQFAWNATHVALSCVKETAGTHLLHHVYVYALKDGTLVAEESRCRTPTFAEGRWMCEKESVDADGVLELTPVFVPVP